MCPSDDRPPAKNPNRPPPAAAAASQTAQEVRSLLMTPADTLPPAARARLEELATTAVEVFVAVLSDPGLRAPQGPGGGWAPVHAASALGQLLPDYAAEPLLDTLATTARMTPLYTSVMQALLPLGRKLISPILARLPTAIGEYRQELWSLLAKSGVRETRVLDQLLVALVENPSAAARRLVEYGDPAALPYLSAELDKYNLGPTDALSTDDSLIFDVREAILSLGGTLTPVQHAKYERAMWSRRLYVAEKDGPKRGPRYRPDAPCPCGSGRQYRHCCLQ